MCTKIKVMIGQIFFELIVNQDNYFHMLKDRVAIPIIKVSMNCKLMKKFYFQQNLAPPHYATKVHNFFNESLSSKYIGRKGAIDWPYRSPDLTPIDFVFCE